MQSAFRQGPTMTESTVLKRQSRAASPVTQQCTLFSNSNSTSILRASALLVLCSLLPRPVSATNSAFVVFSAARSPSSPSNSRPASLSFLDRRAVRSGDIKFFSSSSALKLAVSDEEDGDDDGWGAAPAGGEDGRSKARELAALRSEMSERRGDRQSGSISGSSSPVREEQERDLFIPVFSVVALMGLFGAYGYEMLRLYSRGELYLPWEQ